MTQGSLHWATLSIERLREVRQQFFESSILYRVAQACRGLGRYRFLNLYVSKPCDIRRKWYGVDLGPSVRQEFYLLSGTVVNDLHLHVDQLARVDRPYSNL